ncbi:MAG TPA: SAM-dependent methyltransferase [Opitutae bacterium]|nr:SAM-dependent methyltransferase [Opitutae bacterium]
MMQHTTCPCCQSADLDGFFTICNAPVQSIIAIKSNAAAMQVPRHNIVLTFCNHCGFIFNSEFDTEWDYFTQGYEDQQGFSPTFVRFITATTQRFIDKYALRNQTVIEIGCGKGDFIRLICALGDNQGIGIDPAWVPGRGEPNPNVRFIPEFYNQSHADLYADCITCRHTLEHIFETNDFIEMIRESCHNETPILFFEVPSIVRILKDQAFWDIFGEHCSYFSPGSLAQLFRRNKFEVLDLSLEYDDQYLFIEARPVDAVSNTVHPLEESVADLKALTRLFAQKINKHLEQWRVRLVRLKEENKKVVVWGGGSKAVGFLTQFDEIGVIEHVVDINPHLLGNFIPAIGKQYVGPDFLESYRPDVVILMNSVYINEVRADLAGRGLHPELIGL